MCRVSASVSPLRPVRCYWNIVFNTFLCFACWLLILNVFGWKWIYWLQAMNWDFIGWRLYVACSCHCFCWQSSFLSQCVVITGMTRHDVINLKKHFAGTDSSSQLISAHFTVWCYLSSNSLHPVFFFFYWQTSLKFFVDFTLWETGLVSVRCSLTR